MAPGTLESTVAVNILALSERRGEGMRLTTLLDQYVETTTSPEQLVRRVKRTPDIKVVVIAEDVHLDEATRVAEELRVIDPTLAIILLRTRIDVALVATAMSAGIREALKTNDVTGLVSAVDRHLDLVNTMRAGSTATGSESSSRKIVIVYSAKGGVGKTTVAINMAAALADRDRARVLVVDLDLQFGDIAIVLGLQNEVKNIGQLAPHATDLSAEHLSRAVASYQGKFDVLLAPDTPDQAEQMSGDLVTSILSVARAEYDYVVVDSPPAFTDEILAAFDVSDLQILVTTPDLPSMKNLVVATDTLNRIGLHEVPRVGLINRYPPDSNLGKKTLEAGVSKVTGALVVETIPELAAVAASSVNGGCAYHAPFSAKVKKAFNGLAATVHQSVRR